MIRRHQPDVVFAISSMAGFASALALQTIRNRLPHTKLVYRIGGWTFNDPWPSWQKKIYIILERLSARWKDYIVVNNTADFDQAQALGIRPRIATLRIFNGMDPYPSGVEPIEARTYLNRRIPEHYRHTSYDFLVGTIANFYPAKDLPTLIRSASRVSTMSGIGSRVRFVVIGDGIYRDHLERMIVEHHLEDRFFLLGKIPDASRYLPAFDVFALPSLKEGFPWALLEAMAAKVPVIATRVAAVPEMIEDHQSGLIVEPNHPDELAAAIIELLGNDRLRREYAIRAHQHVMTKFSLREMIAQYEKLFS
jgi:glycosyltransferase involved in cell wall biosynthesis